MQQIEPDRRNDEQINTGNVGSLITQKGPPSRRGRTAQRRHVLGDRGPGNVDPEFQQFAMNAWRAPDGVFTTHGPDEIANVVWDRGSTYVAARLPAPVPPEATPMPAHQRLGIEDDCGIAHCRE